MIDRQIDHSAQKHGGKDQRQKDQAEDSLDFGKAVALGIGQRVGHYVIEQLWIQCGFTELLPADDLADAHMEDLRQTR